MEKDKKEKCPTYVREVVGHAHVWLMYFLGLLILEFDGVLSLLSLLLFIWYIAIGIILMLCHSDGYFTVAIALPFLVIFISCFVYVVVADN